MRTGVLVVFVASIVACSSARHSDRSSATPDAALVVCTRCHGDPANGNAAPPPSVRGERDQSARSVGAHQRHLTAGIVSQPIACSECHTVPSSLNDPGHIDGPRATLTWGPLARAQGVQPEFDGDTLTCNTYCHGSAFAAGDGALHRPSWVTVDGSQTACGTCHGVPPPPPHPAVASGIATCAACHPETVTSAGTIDIDRGKHIDGVVDVDATGAGCTACHGDASRSGQLAVAPPRDTHGNTSASAPGVGAHQAHLAGGNVRAALACTDCHVVPADAVHAAQPLQLTWSALAGASGVTPRFDATALTCSNYCHGASLSGGTLVLPVWTRGPTQVVCGACHGLPPGGGHPAVGSALTGCAVCHPATVRQDGTIDLTGGKHVNGTIEATGGSCTACHGDASRSGQLAVAPPRDTHGNTSESAAGVGAHQAHLVGGNVRAALACTDCHVVPGDAVHATQPLQLTWSALAGASGVVPRFDSAALTCSNYCHGASLSGGTLVLPVWTQGASQAACGTCHGLPPGGGHPAVGSALTGCAACHPATVRQDGTIDVAAGKHVNGTIEATGAGCTACHGDASRSGDLAVAPPRDTQGNTSSSAPGVGAHQAHLVGGQIRAALACTDCHVVPGDAIHATQPLQLTWSTLASASGVTPRFDATALTCSNYCHGASLSGGTLVLPLWTQGASQAACGTCHGLPPGGGHPAVGSALTGCAVCHPATVRPDGTIDVAGGKHVNGAIEAASASCTACHGDASRSGQLAAAPPRDTQGNTSTSAPGVGAHQAHLVGGQIRAALACTDCHLVPSDAVHATQPLQLTWSALASTSGVTPRFDATALTCTNYCHGASLSGGTQSLPVWTQGSSQAACGTCHGLPPGGGHPAVGPALTGCAACHPATVLQDGTIDVAGGRHVNGTIEVTAASCTACHGDASRSGDLAVAPPRDTQGNTSTSAPGVGAHQAHLVGGQIRAALACTDCHLVPSDAVHATQPLQLTWSTLASASGVTPRFDATALTCSNYCHGASLSGGTQALPVWTQGSSQAACGTCHGIPPGGSHAPVGSSLPGCSICHPATVRQDGTIDVAGGNHVNGTIEATAASCTLCHGSPPNTGQHALHSFATCAACHGDGYSSTSVNPSLHLNGTADVGGAGSAVTSWTAPTCTNACHATATW